MRLAITCALMVATSAAWADATAEPPADAPHMLKGPYLQNLAPTSITVMWQTDQPAAAHVVVDGPDGLRSRDVAAVRIGEATIDQLAPSTRYRYRVELAGQVFTGELTTAPQIGSDAPFSFIVLGDTRGGAEAHRRVVERIAQEAHDFVVGTGDMVDDGSHDEQWQQFFDIEHRLMRDNVYFPAIGNHDRQGRGRTADSYRALFAVPENGGDTERYYAFSYARARFLVLDSNAYSFALTDQTAWLERELIAARQDPSVRHIFAVMHHPPFSIALHGGSRELRERWTPLFEKYRVSCVFSGHDHVYERAESGGVRYFVTGGGGAPLYPRRASPSPIDAAAVKKLERAFHFLRVSLAGDRIEVTAVRADGTVIETTAWSDGITIPTGAPTGAPAGEPAGAAPRLALAAAAGGAGASQVLAVSVEPDGPSIVWVGLGGVGLLLAAAVTVVRTLRR